MKKNKIFKIVLTNTLIFMILLISFTNFLFSTEANTICKKADLKLIPEICKYKLKIVVKKKGKIERENIFIGFKKGKDKYLLFTIYPQTIYGQAHLRIKRTIWTYFPLADETIKRNYKTAFLGTGLNYGDVMYSELYSYYNIKLINNNFIYKDKNWNKFKSNINKYPYTFKLLLTLKKGGSGYAKIITYIEKSSLLTLKREYYSLSGDLIKVIYFYDYKSSKNNITSFYMKIENLLMKDTITYSYFSNIKRLKNISDRYFSLSFLKTYQPEDENQ